MRNTVHNVTDLPKPNTLRKFAIRSIVLATAGTVALAVINRVRNSDEEPETPDATA